jgi:hypothetical protein
MVGATILPVGAQVSAPFVDVALVTIPVNAVLGEIPTIGANIGTLVGSGGLVSVLDVVAQLRAIPVQVAAISIDVALIAIAVDPILTEVASVLVKVAGVLPNVLSVLGYVRLRERSQREQYEQAKAEKASSHSF